MKDNLDGADRDASRSAGPALALALAATALGLGGSPDAARCGPNVACAEASEPPVGVVSGTVRLPPAAGRSGPPRLSPYSRARYQAPRAPAPSGRVEDVIVFVATVPAGGATPTRVSVGQEDLSITPHVTTIPVGSVVDFPNHDDVYHNLFSLSGTKRFNLGRYPPGESRSVTFDKPGLVRLFCDIHSDMAAVIYVVEHGFFARPAADGSYRIEGVPPGRHTVVAWHEALPPDSVAVTVPESGTVAVDLYPGR